MPQSTPAKAFVIGEALIDAVHSTDGHIQELPGGSPANVAITLSRQGADATLLTWLAQDVRGLKVAQWLTDSGVTVHPGSWGAQATSVATAHLQDDGSAQYEFDIEWDLLPVCVEPSANVVHTGSIAATLTPGGPKVKDLLASAREFATITYDPNMRPSLMGSPAQVRDQVNDYVELSDVVKVSDEDLEWLYPEASFETVAEEWLAKGPSLVVVTQGGNGATCYLPGGKVSIASPKVSVADTVGAGDSFMGTLIFQLGARGYLGKSGQVELKLIDSATVEEILLQCAKVAAITVSRAGANPPWSTEL